MPKPSDIAAKTFKKDIFATEHKIRIFWETHGYRHPKSRPASLFSPQKGVKRGPRRRQKDLSDVEKCLLFEIEMAMVAKSAISEVAVVSKSSRYFVSAVPHFLLDTNFRETPQNLTTGVFLQNGFGN